LDAENDLYWEAFYSFETNIKPKFVNLIIHDIGYLNKLSYEFEFY